MVQDFAHARGLYLRTIAPDRISFMPPLIIEPAALGTLGFYAYMRGAANQRGA